MRKLMQALSLIVLLSSSDLFAEGDVMLKIQLETSSGEIATATLIDNQPAKDFYNSLPLTLTLSDFADTEKQARGLPNTLNTKESPKGYQPKSGDLAHYKPWNNFIIFYNDDNFANGLVLLGHLDNNIVIFSQKGDITVTMTKITP